MEFRKALTITKYLVKEYVVNPVFKGRRKILGVFIGIIIFMVILVLVVAFTVSAPNNEVNGGNTTTMGQRGNTTSTNIGVQLRGFLHAMGLDKNKIIDLISTLIFLYFTLTMIIGRSILTSSEAEYELLLSQPIGIDTYVIGKTIYGIVHGLIFVPVYFAFIPSSMAINGGNVKALFLPLSMALTFFVFGSVAHNTIAMLNKVFEKYNIRNIVRLVLLIYLTICMVHSIAIQYFSPLLALPFRCFPELLVYPLTITETVYDITLSLGKAICTIVVMFMVLVWSSKYIIPEDIVPLNIIIMRKQVKTYKKSRVPILKFDTPESAVKSYILGSSILNRRHIVNLVITVSLVIVASYVAKLILPNILSIIGIEVSFITSLFIPLFISITCASFIQFILVNDIQAYWIYRVYLIDMESVAKTFLLKYLVYLLEILFIIACIDTILSGNILFILFPLTVMPLMVITGFLILALTLYFVSKKKIVKQMPTGTTILEQVTSTILWTIVIVSLMISKTSYTILLSINSTTPILLLSVASSTVISAILYMIFSRLLASIAQKYDIVS